MPLLHSGSYQAMTKHISLWPPWPPTATQISFNFLFRETSFVNVIVFCLSTNGPDQQMESFLKQLQTPTLTAISN